MNKQKHELSKAMIVEQQFTRGWPDMIAEMARLSEGYKNAYQKMLRRRLEPFYLLCYETIRKVLQLLLP